MKSHVLRSFWDLYRQLPANIRQQADEAYARFEQDPHHPALQFKPIHGVGGVYSARVNSQYRVLGRMRNGEIYWYWIGTHNDYDAHIQSRRQPKNP